MRHTVQIVKCPILSVEADDVIWYSGKWRLVYGVDEDIFHPDQEVLVGFGTGYKIAKYGTLIEEVELWAVLRLSNDTKARGEDIVVGVVDPYYLVEAQLLTPTKDTK